MLMGVCTPKHPRAPRYKCLPEVLLTGPQAIRVYCRHRLKFLLLRLPGGPCGKPSAAGFPGEFPIFVVPHEATYQFDSNGVHFKKVCAVWHIEILFAHLSLPTPFLK